MALKYILANERIILHTKNCWAKQKNNEATGLGCIKNCVPACTGLRKRIVKVAAGVFLLFL